MTWHRWNVCTAMLFGDDGEERESEVSPGTLVVGNEAGSRRRTRAQA